MKNTQIRLYANEEDRMLAKVSAARRGVTLQQWLAEAIREKAKREEKA